MKKALSLVLAALAMTACFATANAAATTSSVSIKINQDAAFSITPNWTNLDLLSNATKYIQNLSDLGAGNTQTFPLGDISWVSNLDKLSFGGFGDTGFKRTYKSGNGGIDVAGVTASDVDALVTYNFFYMDPNVGKTLFGTLPAKGTFTFISDVHLGTWTWDMLGAYGARSGKIVIEAAIKGVGSMYDLKPGSYSDQLTFTYTDLR